VNDDTPPRGTQVSGDGYWFMVIERLTRIETTLEGIRRDRDEMQKDIDKGREDHENRIRSIEKWKYMLPPTLVTALVSMGVTLYGQIGK
jgi:hypothetical protein